MVFPLTCGPTQHFLIATETVPTQTDEFMGIKNIMQELILASEVRMQLKLDKIMAALNK